MVRLDDASTFEDMLHAMSTSDSTAVEPTDSQGAGVAGFPSDWPHQATSKIVDVIDEVRVKTSGPAIGISRTVVYGLVIVLLLPVASTLLTIASVRGLNEAIPGEVGPIYLGLGAIFALVGLICWSRRPRGAAG